MSTSPPSRLQTGRDPALDGLRGLAVLSVFVFHYGGGLRATNPVVRVFGYVSQAGWAGVDLFFALSGFLITTQLMADLGVRHALRNFFVRRALRIVPLYAAALLACAVVALCSGASAAQLRPLLLYAGFVQNIPALVAQALRTPPPLPLFHLWSVALEVQFYLLWPFLLLLARSRRSAFLLCCGLFAAGCLFRVALFAFPPMPLRDAQHFAFSLFTRGGALALGGALAIGWQLYPKLPWRAIARWAAIAAVLTWLLTFAFTGSLMLRDIPSFLFSLPAVDVLAAALLALSLGPGPLRRAVSRPILVFFGRISYGFYVFHLLLEPVFDWLGFLFTHQDSGFVYQGLRLLCALPITAAVAWLSFRLLELPLLRLKRFVPLHQASPPQAQVAEVI